MIDPEMLENWKHVARRDDACNYFVPSDIRVMIGEIERLQAEVKRLSGAK